jgi:hypothetical protein
MKITREHLQILESAIKPLDTTERRRFYIDSGLSDTRYRFDLLYRCGLTLWVCDTLYKYVDNTHIATALKRIVPPLRDNVAQ